MKTVIGVASFEETMKQSQDRAEKRARGEAARPLRRILFEDPVDMMEFMTPDRVRLFREVKERALSVTDLASLLERKRSAVRSDVRALRARRLVRLIRKTSPGHEPVTLVSARAKKVELRANL